VPVVAVIVPVCVSVDVTVVIAADEAFTVVDVRLVILAVVQLILVLSENGTSFTYIVISPSYV